MTENEGILSDMMCEKNIRTVDVIVPCFNEEENLDAFLRKAAAFSKAWKAMISEL